MGKALVTTVKVGAALAIGWVLGAVSVIAIGSWRWLREHRVTCQYVLVMGGPGELP